MKHQRPNTLIYKIAQGISWLAAVVLFRRKFIRNEIKGKEGPFVVLANHEAALDFVCLIGATGKPMNFVISQSFFSTLPFQGILKKMGLIPKQQFQTTVKDLKTMKSVIDHGDRLVVYPAGLMCEDGLSTPIPSATYKFIKWMDADIYVARIQGSYFVMPKWGKGFRPGKTTMDIYKLFSREELKGLSLEQVQKKADEALLYDAYREQEQLQVKYCNNRDLRGLEKVLYQCPACGQEFAMKMAAKDTLCCSSCGFTATGDPYGFLSTNGRELRYVSDWSREIYESLKQKVLSGQEQELSAPVQIAMVDPKKHKFVPVGQGQLTLNLTHMNLTGQLNGEDADIRIPAGSVPTLPFKPGKYLELQDGSTIYRCIFEDGRSVMKFVNMIKLLYAVKKEQSEAVPAL